jgi:hypothetical protein
MVSQLPAVAQREPCASCRLDCELSSQTSENAQEDSSVEETGICKLLIYYSRIANLD